MQTIREWCEANRVSRSWLYAEWKAQRGPAIVRRGRKVLIPANDNRKPEAWKPWPAAKREERAA